MATGDGASGAAGRGTDGMAAGVGREGTGTGAGAGAIGREPDMPAGSPPTLVGSCSGSGGMGDLNSGVDGTGAGAGALWLCATAGSMAQPALSERSRSSRPASGAATAAGVSGGVGERGAAGSGSPRLPSAGPPPRPPGAGAPPALGARAG